MCRGTSRNVDYSCLLCMSKLHVILVLGIGILLGLFQFAESGQAQKKAQEPVPTQSPDVLRINTRLVQTDVMVFDKKGRFVEGLQPEQFELLVDGKRQPISFFETIRTGSDREEAQLIAAVSGRPQPSALTTTSSSVHGRTILFFVDDLHTGPNSILRVRETLLEFVDHKLADGDQVAITSASGRVGFLQQLTDNKAVLRAAVERISYAAAMGLDHENPPMSEYAAFLIVEQHDRLPQKAAPGVASAPTSLFDYFVLQTMKEDNVDRPIAEAIVDRRATAIVRNSATTNKLTLLTLGNLMQSLAKVTGRKLVFFMSDGFIPNYAGSDIADSINRATETANAAGVVIYSIDARGLATDPHLDPSVSGGFDSTGVLTSRLAPELSASQEPLHAVALPTGGRALLNTNALDESIGKGLDETSNYYLLAWRPDTADNRIPKPSNIKVSIAGRPDLEVKLRRGYLGMAARPSKSKAKAADTAAAENEMLSESVTPTRVAELPTALFVGYKRGSGSTAELLAFIGVSDDESEGNPATDAQVVGVVFDSNGKPVGSFRRGVTITKTKSQGLHGTANYQVNLPAGLYQVRVFARDKNSGRLGTAHQWLEIPNVKSGQLSLSSLYLGEIGENSVNETQEVSISPSRRFVQASSLRFTTYIYGASQDKTPPDLAIQTTIARGGIPLVTTPERKVSTDKLSGGSAIPYSAQFPLNKLPAGRYRLEIIVKDRSSKSTASQQAEFVVY